MSILLTWARQGNNFTYNTDMGGFGDDNQMSLDQRGFKWFIQAEAAEFLQPNQTRFNSTVKKITYSDSGVAVQLVSGETLHADYAICTFSVGVLQHDDVVFEPALPDWKQEAIQSMVMVGALRAARSARFVLGPRCLFNSTPAGNVYEDLPTVPGELLVRYGGEPTLDLENSRGLTKFAQRWHYMRTRSAADIPCGRAWTTRTSSLVPASSSSR